MITHQPETLEQFIRLCGEKGVRGVALQEVDEIRPELEQLGSGVTVGQVRFATVVAYAAGEVIRLKIPDPPADLRAQLQAMGLPLRRVNHNLG